MEGAAERRPDVAEADPAKAHKVRLHLLSSVPYQGIQSGTMIDTIGLIG